MTMLKLCDTNILSELAKARPNPGVLEWAETERRLALSVITIDELYFGLAWRPHPKIRAWLDDFLAARCEALDITPEIARIGGELRGNLQARGRIRTQADALIAATARAHGLTLVTRNVKDFEDCGVAILNPFR